MPNHYRYIDRDGKLTIEGQLRRSYVIGAVAQALNVDPFVKVNEALHTDTCGPHILWLDVISESQDMVFGNMEWCDTSFEQVVKAVAEDTAQWATKVSGQVWTANV